MKKNVAIERIFDRLRYDYPLHFVMMITSWFPNSVTFYKIRGIFARPFFGSCGSNLRINRNIEFLNASSISIGRDVYIAVNCVFLAIGNIDIGDEVMFGPNVVVSAGKHTKASGSYRFAPEEKAPIKIGSGTWVGANSTIAGGATIGSGCVIGCNAAVTRGVIPSNSLAVGVPAVVKRDEKEMSVQQIISSD